MTYLAKLADIFLCLTVSIVLYGALFCALVIVYVESMQSLTKLQMGFISFTLGASIMWTCYLIVITSSIIFYSDPSFFLGFM